MDTYPESVSAAANYIEVLMYTRDWDALAKESEAAFGKFPEETAFLAPGIIYEIHYRFFMGPLGRNLRRFSTVGTHGNQIAHAVAWLRDNYREPLQVRELARRVNMGTSTFVFQGSDHAQPSAVS